MNANKTTVAMSAVDITLAFRDIMDYTLVEKEAYNRFYRAGEAYYFAVEKEVIPLHATAFPMVWQDFIADSTDLPKRKVLNEQYDSMEQIDVLNPRWRSKTPKEIKREVQMRNSLLAAMYMGYRAHKWGKILFQFDWTSSMLVDIHAPVLAHLAIENNWIFYFHYSAFSFFDLEREDLSHPGSFRKWTEHKFTDNWTYDVETWLFFIDDLCKNNPSDRLDRYRKEFAKKLPNYTPVSWLYLLENPKETINNMEEGNTEGDLFERCLKATGLAEERSAFFRFEHPPEEYAYNWSTFPELWQPEQTSTS